MNKLEKLEREQEKARKRIAEYQARLKELDGAVTAQENLQIVEAVRALKLTQKELRAFISGGALPKGLPGVEAMPAARFAKKPEDKTAAVATASVAGTVVKPITTDSTIINESEGRKDE